MTRVDFYHLQQKSLEDVLPPLLQKAYSTGKRIKIKTPNEERTEYINSLLWTFNDESFLPHGSKKTVLQNNSRFGFRLPKKTLIVPYIYFW